MKSARRTIEVFEFFAEHQSPASVSDVGRALGYPQSSTSAILKSLVTLGYLSYDRHERLYQPTLRVTLIGNCLRDSKLGHPDLAPAVQAIFQATNRTTALFIENGIFAQCVMMLRPGQHSLSLRTGVLWPICRTASGQALLSSAPPATALAILRRANAKERDSSLRMGEADLLNALKFCRQHGFAYTEGTLYADRAVVAIPLPPGPDNVPISLAVGGPIRAMRQERSEILGIMRREIDAAEILETQRRQAVAETPASR